MRGTVLLPVLAVVLLNAHTCFAKDIYVAGQVFDEDGNPVEWAHIVFVDEVTGQKFYTESGWEGHYDIYLGPIGVKEDTPTSFSLQQNYPNPFNPTTTIPFSLDKDGSVNLTIYNVLGQKVRTLINDHLTTGSHAVTWNCRDDDGMSAGAGVYLYQLRSGKNVETKKMLLLDGGSQMVYHGSPVSESGASSSHGIGSLAKIADDRTFRVSISGEGIVPFLQTGVSVIEDEPLDFVVNSIGEGFAGSHTYYPVEIGAYWSYYESEIDYESGETDEEIYLKEVLGTAKVNGKEYWVYEGEDDYERIDQDGTLYLMWINDEYEDDYVSYKIAGKIFVSEKAEKALKIAAASEENPFADEFPFLKLNAGAEETWDIISMSFTEYDEDEGITYDYTISVTGTCKGLENVETVLGTFEDCKKFEIDIDIEVTGASGSDTGHTTEKETFWLAPDVGLVKATYTETSDEELYEEEESVLIRYAKEYVSGIDPGTHTYFPLNDGALYIWAEKDSVFWDDEYEETSTGYDGQIISGTSVVNNREYWRLCGDIGDVDEVEAYSRIENDILYILFPLEYDDEEEYYEKIARVIPGSEQSLNALRAYAQSTQAFKTAASSVHMPFLDELTLVKFNVSAGTTWEIENFSYTDDESGVSYSLLYTGEYKGTETVETPLGVYENCKKFELNFEETWTLGDESEKDLGISTMWFAPNVGIVKSIESDLDGEEQRDHEYIVRYGTFYSGSEAGTHEYAPLATGLTLTFKDTYINHERGETDTGEASDMIYDTATMNGTEYWMLFEVENGEREYLPDVLIRIDNGIVYLLFYPEEDDDDYAGKSAPSVPVSGHALKALKTAAKASKSATSADFIYENPLLFELLYFKLDASAGESWEIVNYSETDSETGASLTIMGTGTFIGTEDVDVPAGTFTGCKKFEITMETTWSVGKESENSINTNTFFFAPGVGWIKEIDTYTEDGVLREEYIMELKSYSMP